MVSCGDSDSGSNSDSDSDSEDSDSDSGSDSDNDTLILLLILGLQSGARQGSCCFLLVDVGVTRKLVLPSNWRWRTRVAGQC